MKIYCKDCVYCGKLAETNDDKIRTDSRYCMYPEELDIEIIDTWYEHKSTVHRNMCHKLNKNNDCIYFKAKEEE